MPVRDIDALDPLPDEKLKQLDKAYLEKHQLDKLFGDVLRGIVTNKPPDPIQYVIDYVTFGPEPAVQDPITGLPEQRRKKLMKVFQAIDKGNKGYISLKHLQQYTDKYGGESLSASELHSIFEDFRPSKDTDVRPPDFLVFFAKVSKSIPNTAFDQMINDLLL